MQDNKTLGANMKDADEQDKTVESIQSVGDMEREINGSLSLGLFYGCSYVVVCALLFFVVNRYFTSHLDATGYMLAAFIIAIPVYGLLVRKYIFFNRKKSMIGLGIGLILSLLLIFALMFLIASAVRF